MDKKTKREKKRRKERQRELRRTDLLVLKKLLSTIQKLFPLENNRFDYNNQS